MEDKENYYCPGCGQALLLPDKYDTPYCDTCDNCGMEIRIYCVSEKERPSGWTETCADVKIYF